MPLLLIEFNINNKFNILSGDKHWNLTGPHCYRRSAFLDWNPCKNISRPGTSTWFCLDVINTILNREFNKNKRCSHQRYLEISTKISQEIEFTPAFLDWKSCKKSLHRTYLLVFSLTYNPNTELIAKQIQLQSGDRTFSRCFRIRHAAGTILHAVYFFFRRVPSF